MAGRLEARAVGRAGRANASALIMAQKPLTLRSPAGDKHPPHGDASNRLCGLGGLLALRHDVALGRLKPLVAA